MSGWERVGLALTLAVIFIMIFGVGSGVWACGVLGGLLGIGLGVIID